MSTSLISLILRIIAEWEDTEVQINENESTVPEHTDEEDNIISSQGMINTLKYFHISM